ncbi:MAG: twin-arginine translocation pathway signal [Mycobacteriaceae bacterium]|nr:twin-arginine translocation pathway signal [Mycobacteriaceae bacterium]
MTAEQTSVDAEENRTEDDDRRSRGRLRRLAGTITRRLPDRLGPAVWIVLVVASLALFASLAYFMYRPDKQTDDAANRAALAAASEGTVAVYSYASNTVDRDIDAAKTHLTGDFLAQYERDSKTGVAAVAKQKPMKTSATVVAAAVSQLRPSSAEVLIFLDQTTTTVGAPGPTMSVGSLVVSLSKVNGKWLISAMKPI